MEIDAVGTVVWVTDFSVKVLASALLTLLLIALPLLRPLSGQRRVAIPLEEVWRIIVCVTIFAVLITTAVNKVWGEIAM